MSVDNPYYFNSDLPTSPPATVRQPPSPTSSTKSGGFFFFRRRSSSSGSSKSVKSPKTKAFNSATLGAEAAILGNRRSSLSSLLRPAAASVSSPTTSYLPTSPYGHPITGNAATVYGAHHLKQHPNGAVYGSGGHHMADPVYRNTMQMTTTRTPPKRIFFGTGGGGGGRPRHDSASSQVENDEVFLNGFSGPSSLNALQSISPYQSDAGVGHPYPYGSAVAGQRRHSIGTSAAPPGGPGSNHRDRLRCGSVSDEVPKTYAPRPPVQSTSRNHRPVRRAGNLPTAPQGGFWPSGYNGTNVAGGSTGGVLDDTDDILIVTARQSEPAILWANYLRQRFDKITKQRGRQPFNFLHIKIDEEPITAELSRRCQTTKLQIVILCSSLIALPDHFLMSQLCVVLRPEIVLGIILEVPEERIMEIHRKAFPSYKKWRRCVVHNQDQSLVGKVLGIATDILGRALCQRPPCQTTAQTGYSSSTTASSEKTHHSNSNTESFTILPRKVKVGQNKVVALLNEPLAKDDVVRIRIEKTGDLLDVVHFKRRNPYTLQFTIPESCMEVSTMIEIQIERNDILLGSRPVKCESRLRELEQILKTQDSPVDFMCHSLGIVTPDRMSLDSYLHHTFQRNVPPNFHLVSGPKPQKQMGIFNNKDSSSEEFPTLLHFAAKWGLEHLSMLLMECPGGEMAIEMRNSSGRTPAELAESAGYLKLAGSLKNFSQMNEFTTMYHYFKGISSPTENDTSLATNSNNVMISLKPGTSTTTSASQQKNRRPGFLPSPPSTASRPEYMEMSPGSDAESSSTATILNAVTNLNYINIESTKDEEIQRNLDDSSSSTEPEIMSNELRIQEPAYFDSNEQNQKSDAFSQDCLNVLENCRSNRSVNSSAAPTPTPPNSNTPLPSTSHPSRTVSPSNSDSDYMQPSNIPVEHPSLPKKSTSAVVAVDLGDYMMQPSNRPVETPKPTASPTPEVPEDDLVKVHFNQCKPKHGTLKRQESDVSKASVDDELLEIMNDFKNNVFTIQEVEQLVLSWKGRNDVQQSYKDKQEQLAKMRSEYERLQEQMKEKLKRPTPFERMRKLFSRSKSQSVDESSSTDASLGDNSKQGGNRPRSSLSLQSLSSTSSSGRLSTGSACSGASLGDSGTHSDPDERRQGFGGSQHSCRVGTPGSLMLDNYLIPPAPRPVSTPVTTPTSPCGDPGHKYFSAPAGTGKLSLALNPTENNLASENYVMFPSNVPVYPAMHHEHNNNGNYLASSPTGSHHHGHHDYMNFSGLNTIEETKETADITVQPIKIQKPEGIYGPIVKKSTSNLCSSFKAPISPSVSVSPDGQQVAFNKNATDLDAKTHECLKSLSRSIDGCTASLSLIAGAPDCSAQHDYMNV